jgi:hypothetical protein
VRRAEAAGRCIESGARALQTNRALFFDSRRITLLEAGAGFAIQILYAEERDFGVRDSTLRDASGARSRKVSAILYSFDTKPTRVR